MEILMSIGVVILIALYLFFFCVPGYFLIREYDSPVSPGCSMIIVGIIGFPGMILGLLITIPDVIKKKSEKNREKTRLAEQLRKQEEEEKNARINYEKQVQNKKIENKNIVTRYQQSEEVKKMIDYIKSVDKFPYKIEIYNNCVSFSYNKGTGNYDFLTNGLNNISFECCIGTKNEFNELYNKQTKAYWLATVINESFNNAFLITENWDDLGEQSNSTYINNHVYKALKSVSLTRGLKDF